MTNRKFTGLARVQDVHGVQYMISYQRGETDGEIVARASRFYEQEIVKVVFLF